MFVSAEWRLLMLKEHINENDAIKIYHTQQIMDDFSGKNDFQICCGKIKKIVSDSELEVEISDAICPKLKKDICYILYIYTSQKVYRCSTYYHSMYSDEGKIYFCLEVVSSLEKIQRRMHQRVSCHSRILVQVLEPEQVQKIVENKDRKLFNEYKSLNESFEDSMVDISGGGIRFTTKNKVNVYNYLYVTFEIMSNETAVELNIIGEVVYSALLPNDQECFDVRMKYIGLSKKEREQIIHFVFQLERDEMGKNWK